ncbi:hypothetical protein N0V94_004067 [Neodidymelliopsis sp. IMI 364377]|nr:hypothetical protein N0V94_004067 [Neodidymelliopsis sp. IMI 364377]
MKARLPSEFEPPEDRVSSAKRTPNEKAEARNAEMETFRPEELDGKDSDREETKANLTKNLTRSPRLYETLKLLQEFADRWLSSSPY